MTLTQAKAIALRYLAGNDEARAHALGPINQVLFPDGKPRMLCWFEFVPNTQGLVIYKTMPVICGKSLPVTALRIQSDPDFSEWGLNPWTGEMADLRFQF